MRWSARASPPAMSDTWRRTGPERRLVTRSKSKQPVRIGSAKTNIGHLDAAAGIAGLLKVILSPEHEELPKHLHFRNPSPHIPWDRLAVEVVQEATPWERNGRPRIAGVSSFGFAGTNAHVILEEAPVETAQPAAVEQPEDSRSDVAAGAAPRSDVAAGAAPRSDVAAGAAPRSDVAAGAAPRFSLLPLSARTPA